ncbi:hypothetical protein [Hafnia psychrotolerans]|jgi:hypothetical protein|uniref:hypothetical protein n=1 Tax=Hafnia psychrotolerans TaxID=1477018 RepID=UPI001669D680|nr:hypothetical protein [Hafnia psychrotolerans]
MKGDESNVVLDSRAAGMWLNAAAATKIYPAKSSPAMLTVTRFIAYFLFIIMVLNISKNIHKIACINIVVANKKSIL